MVLIAIIVFNLIILDYASLKALKMAKNIFKMNGYIQATDLDDDFWDEV